MQAQNYLVHSMYNTINMPALFIDRSCTIASRKTIMLIYGCLNCEFY